MLSKILSKYSLTLSNNWKIIVLSGALMVNSAFSIYAQTNSVSSGKEPTCTSVEDNSPIIESLETPIITKNHPQYLLNKIAEAQKILAKECELDDFTVGISIMEKHSGEIQFVKMLKTNFITRGYQEDFTLLDDKQIKVTIDQPNFINTKVNLDSKEGKFLPLMVKYPIIRGGKFKEMGYYVPAHRSLQNEYFAKLGDEYIEKVLTKANKELKRDGLDVSEKVFNLAKLLCIVEHIDHGRYRTEDKQNLFNEVRTLYALNQTNTYRYAVSSAGAGGMVQMISSTYREIKSSFPQVDWVGNFEQAMMTHENAAKAMLLYLNRYYNFFADTPSVKNAWENKIATEEEIMAAGYNSNPTKVPSTLSQGEYWKRGLPQETQIYLSILRSLDSSVTITPPEFYQAPDRVSRVVYKPKRQMKEQIRNVRFKSRYRASSRYSTRYKSSLRSPVRASSPNRYKYQQSTKSKTQVTNKKTRHRW